MGNVTPISYYPMAELYTAFDAAISAAGYNTAMELLNHGVPTAFVPFPRQVDDQDARVSRIESLGAGIRLSKLEPDSIRRAVSHLLDPVQSRGIREVAIRMFPANGANAAAEAILRLVSV